MKEILIKNNGTYRTIPATALQAADDGSYIESDCKSNRVFSLADISNTNSANVHKLNSLIELLYNKFICDDKYKCCLIDEDEDSVILENSQDKSQPEFMLFKYINGSWIWASSSRK